MFGNLNSILTSDWWTSPKGLGFTLLMLWSLFWKALALWRAAREDSKPWFAALLVINTVGILEIIYLFFIAKEKLTLGSLTAGKVVRKN